MGSCSSGVSSISKQHQQEEEEAWGCMPGVGLLPNGRLPLHVAAVLICAPGADACNRKDQAATAYICLNSMPPQQATAVRMSCIAFLWWWLFCLPSTCSVG
eukprot:GHRQ01021067.1.p2 GENE.GHRQ01021067.1~~GHRQ01021067.1.p2  ORF type:complete len:101 (-),score=10.33 GHRQ01021067.1:361-663(-)